MIPKPTPLLAGLAIAAACSKPTPPPAGVQLMIETHCGTCHRSDQETAKPEALAVFDLMPEEDPSGSELQSMVSGLQPD
jgi:hypothetical protein